MFRQLATVALVGAAIMTGSGTTLADGRNWSGIYIGAHAGYGFGDAKATDVQPPLGGFFTPTGNSFSFDTDGFIGGGQIGIQHQFGRWVLGAEVSYSAAEFEKSIVSPFFPASDTEKMSVGPILMVTGRVGYTFDNVLAYVKGGYAGGDVEFSANDALAVVSYTQSSWQNGYVVGAGLELALTKNISLGLEYNYVDLRADTRQGFASDGGTELYKLESDFHTIGARLNFLFGRERHHEPMK